jgi:urease gamma subunit
MAAARLRLLLTQVDAASKAREQKIMQCLECLEKIARINNEMMEQMRRNEQATAEMMRICHPRIITATCRPCLAYRAQVTSSSVEVLSLTCKPRASD